MKFIEKGGCPTDMYDILPLEYTIEKKLHFDSRYLTYIYYSAQFPDTIAQLEWFEFISRSTIVNHNTISRLAQHHLNFLCGFNATIIYIPDKKKKNISQQKFSISALAL